MLSSKHLYHPSYTPSHLSHSVLMPSVTYDNHIVPISIVSIMPTLSPFPPTSPHQNPKSITATSPQSVPPTFLVATDLSFGSYHNASTEFQPAFQPESLQMVLSIPSMNTHVMQTRSKSGIF